MNHPQVSSSFVILSKCFSDSNLLVFFIAHLWEYNVSDVGIFGLSVQT